MHKKHSISYWRGVMATLMAMYGENSTVRYVIVRRKIRKARLGW